MLHIFYSIFCTLYFCLCHWVGFCLSSECVLGQPAYFLFHCWFLYLWELFQGLILIALISQLLFRSCNLIYHLIVTALTGRLRNTLKHTPKVIGHLSNCQHWWMVLISTCWFYALLLSIWVTYSISPIKLYFFLFVVSSDKTRYVISCQITKKKACLHFPGRGEEKTHWDI